MIKCYCISHALETINPCWNRRGDAIEIGFEVVPISFQEHEKSVPFSSFTLRRWFNREKRFRKATLQNSFSEDDLPAGIQVYEKFGKSLGITTSGHVVTYNQAFRTKNHRPYELDPVIHLWTFRTSDDIIHWEHLPHYSRLPKGNADIRSIKSAMRGVNSKYERAYVEQIAKQYGISVATVLWIAYVTTMPSDKYRGSRGILMDSTANLHPQLSHLYPAEVE